MGAVGVGGPCDFNGGPIPFFTWLDVGGLRDRGGGLGLGLGIDKDSSIPINIIILPSDKVGKIGVLIKRFFHGQWWCPKSKQRKVKEWFFFKENIFDTYIA